MINGNIGVDNIGGAIASAGTITLPVNPTIAVSGTTTVTTINGAWSNRHVLIYPTNASGFSITGGAGSTCTNVVGTPERRHFPDLERWPRVLARWVTR